MTLPHFIFWKEHLLTFFTSIVCSEVVAIFSLFVIVHKSWIVSDRKVYTLPTTPWLLKLHETQISITYISCRQLRQSAINDVKNRQSFMVHPILHKFCKEKPLIEVWYHVWYWISPYTLFYRSLHLSRIFKWRSRVRITFWSTAVIGWLGRRFGYVRVV